MKPIKIKKQNKSAAMPDVGEENWMERQYPSFRVTENQMSEIKKWEVGEKYKIVIEVNMAEKEERKNHPVTASFEVVGYQAGKAVEEMSDDEIENMQAKAMST